MEEYIRLADNKYDYYKTRIPRSEGTLFGMKDKINTMQKELDQLANDLHNLKNKFIQDNNVSDQEIEKMSEINSSLQKRYVQNYNK